MRLITSITADETLLAGGVYAYLLNDQPAGVTEPWTIHRLSDGKLITRVEREASAYGSTLLLEAVNDAPASGGSFRQFEIHAFNQQLPAVAEVRAKYTFINRTVHLERTINGTPVKAEKLELPVGAVVSPLMRVFLGSVILQVAARGAGTPVPVLVPSLENPADPAELLRPLFDQRSATRSGEDETIIGDRRYQTTRWQYLSNHYDQQSQFWLDEQGLLVRYLFHQSEDKIWNTLLTEDRR